MSTLKQPIIAPIFPAGITEQSPPMPVLIDVFNEMEDGRGFELVDGRLLEKGMGANSSSIQAHLLFLIKAFLKVSRIGRAFDAECGFHMFPDRPNHLRKPDVSFVTNERLQDGRAPEGWFRLAPDFASEVISPNEIASEVDKKITEYLSAGVRLVWVIYPDTRTAHVLRPSRHPLVTDESGILSGEDVLPGFECRLGELFE